MDRQTLIGKLRTVTEDSAKAAAAADAVMAWLTEARYAPFRPALEDLLRRERWDLVFDGFHQVLPFGTGGRRGAVGVGPNRMNPVTVRDAVQGHCLFLRERFPGEALRVVLA
ncbi:MAG: phospho-sugar mutase, partial [Deltaproteobacteria bacterium]|nr:phospho-sugar mutase [Deltaproteobacteria bacterium]